MKIWLLNALPWAGFLLRPRVSFILMASLCWQPVVAQTTTLPEIQVSADQRLAESWQPIGNRSLISTEQINQAAPRHPAELLNQLPGVWISRGDGQEHLTAIRSPVLTGPGACGAFLLLEDGIPIRPAGFCNINNLFELHYEQAGELELIRGPASALYGGNALHGVINQRSAPLVPRSTTRLRVETGHDDYLRLGYSVNRPDALGGWRLDYSGSRDNSWRDNAGYNQQKLTLQRFNNSSSWQIRSRLSGTWLEQETAGFVFGNEAYKEPGLRRDNFNPEAFRNAWSLRASTEFSRETVDGRWVSFTPYLRSSRMEFLQHFLPEKSLEQNSQQSAGLLTSIAGSFGQMHSWSWHNQIEIADLHLQEIQQQPVTIPSAFLQETRPPGTHYDYDVSSLLAATHINVDWQLAERLRLVTSGRLEYLRYDYDNRFLDGNSKPDGTPCGFGGCRFSRPADRDDHFNNIGARVGLNYTDHRQAEWYLSGGAGFRPPQANELYRLQSGQTVADLDSETIYSLELGQRRQLGRLTYEITLFAMDKENVILRDATGSNLSNGKSRHHGVEVAAKWRVTDRQEISLNATHARHRYDFDSTLAGGESIKQGDQIDTAPEHLANLQWRINHPTGRWWQLETQYMGSYPLDAANSARYSGHLLFHLRGGLQLASRSSLSLSITNLTNRDYAERADFAFGNFRYFPGAPRQLRVSFSQQW